jgi:hypothetical protein
MSVISRVEIGFDLSGNPNLPYIVLDDDVKGVLGSPDYFLGGVAFYDVTDKVIGFSIARGKSRYLDRFPAGKLTIQLNNNDRSFDPLFTDSPYAGQIIPRREVRVFVNDEIAMEAVIDDWDLDYSPEGNSVASIIASDALTIFANQTLNEITFSSELSGERVARVLNNPNVNWSVDKRDLEDGLQTLQADTVPEGTNALEYLQKVTSSEPGGFFIAKNGFATFRDRIANQSSDAITEFSDDGVGIPYKTIQVIYGSELLYNEVTVNIQDGGSATATSSQSQIDYGISSLTLDDLLLSSVDDATDMAKFLVSKYNQPEYRIQSVTIDLQNISTEDAEKALALDLNDVCEITFTPNNIPPAIKRFTEVISISHRVTPTSHELTLGFAALDLNFWRLSDLVFGRLSAGNSLAY